jgi:redox-sensitive bicupin YhaK (pirin superfamily)
MTTTTRDRSIAGVLPAVETLEGEGFVVRRPFPVAGLEQLDPFLLLDHLGPRDLAPGEAKGAPDHPHRGFETVTYILEGELEHEDSVGNHGIIGPGDVQWMTAGAGVVHSEMPSRRMQVGGGRLHGFQLWVNLPRDAKMTAPRYQEVTAASIPVVERSAGAAGRGAPSVTVRIIAGEVDGVTGAVDTHTPIAYLHVTVPPGASTTLPAPVERNAMTYVVSGVVVVGDRPSAEAELVVLDRDGGEVTLSVPEDAPEPAEVLVLQGTPIAEPLFRYGPFVMNTKAEIIQAIEDFQAGRMGAIAR